MINLVNNPLRKGVCFLVEDSVGVSGNVSCFLDADLNHCSDLLRFINEDHKEMHGVLLQDGFTFEVIIMGRYNKKVIFEYTQKETELIISFRNNSCRVDTRYIASGICSAIPKNNHDLEGRTFKEVTAYFTQKMLLDNAPKRVPIFLNSVKDVNESLTEYARTNTNFLKGTKMINSVNGLSGKVQICLNPKTGETISSNYGDSLKFINDDHKEMHEVLLGKDFIFGCSETVANGCTWDFVYDSR